MTNSCILKTIDDFELSIMHTEAKGKAVVLWLHGITVDKNEYLNFFKEGSQYLEALGVDSLRIDFRGHGESSGTSLDFSIVGQMMDVEAALNYLNQRYSEKGFTLYIVGCSFGAAPAIFAALRWPKIVKNIILIAPVLSYIRTFIQPETEWGQSIFNVLALSKMEKTKKLYINDDFPISIRLVEEMRLIDPLVALKQLKQGVTIIHGDADSMVPYDVSKQAASAMSTVKLFTFKNMDHGFTDVDDEIGTSLKSQENKKRIYDIISEICR